MSVVAEPADFLTIAGDGWTLALAPSSGAVLACDFEKSEILRRYGTRGPAGDLFGVSHFPLAPYSNRLADGAFAFRGERFRIAPNVRGCAHPMHGTAWLGEWSVIDHARDSITLLFENAPHRGWPWRFALRQAIRINDQVLSVELALKNADARAMPAGMGFHPYFSDPNAARLSFEASGYWRADEAKLPAQWRPLSEERDFCSGRALAGLSIDHCFTGRAGAARIEWRDRPVGVEIAADPALAFAVLYVSQDEDCFCFEPVSQMNNALNWAARRDDTGLRVLEPGEEWTTFMTLRAIKPRA